MIRRVAMLALLSALFLYTAWNAYVELFQKTTDAGAVQKSEQKTAAAGSEEKYSGAWSEAILEKNLFSPERTYHEPKPVPVVIPKPVEPPPKRPELALKGIVLDTFGDYVGYIEINEARALPMRKGDKVEEVEVVDIQEKKVVLQWMTETITLSMDKIKTIKNPRTGR